MASPLPLENRLQALARQIARTRVLFDLWWLTAAEEYRTPYAGVFESYPSYFTFVEHGLRVATLVQAVLPFDKTKGTLSLWRLTQELRREGVVTKHEALGVEGRLDELASIVSRCSTIRNNAFAHRSQAMEYNAVFAEAGVRWEEIRHLITESLDIVNELLRKAGWQQVEASSSPAEDGRLMLDDLLRSQQD